MSYLQKIFVDNIAKQLNIQQLKQSDIAKRTGIEQSRFSRIANGKVEPGIFTIEKIADGLGISASELLLDGSNPDPLLNERLLKIESLNTYDQKLIDALIESLYEKSQLEKLQNVKMKKRLEELGAIRDSTSLI